MNTTTLNSREATKLGFLLAFNLGDLLTIKREEPILMMALIRPVLLDSGAIICFDRQHIDGDYVPAVDIDAERAQAIVDVVRLKVPRYRLRMRLRKCDRSKRGRWVAV